MLSYFLHFLCLTCSFPNLIFLVIRIRQETRRCEMPMNRREFLAASVAGAAMFAARDDGVRRSEGEYPSRNRCVQDWRADHSADFRRVHGAGDYASVGRDADRQEVCQPDYQRPAAAGEFLLPPLSGEPFRPVGPEGTVEMDTVRPFVGEHSPRVKLDGSAPHGIQQSRLRLRRRASLMKAGFILPAIPAPKLRSVWSGGPAPSDSQTIPIPSLVARVPEIPVEVHSAGRHRGGAPGNLWAPAAAHFTSAPFR